MEPRPEPTRAATPPLRIASPRIRKRGERIVGFEGAQSRGESRVERNTEGGRPSEETPRGNGGQSVNLPPLLAAHLGRGENGKPLQSCLTSAYGGQTPPNNIGGNLPSNGLHEEQQIDGFVHGLRTKSLVEHLSTDLPSTYKGLMEKTHTWLEAREVATNGISNNQRDDFKRSKKFSWGNSIGQKDRGRFSPYKGQNHKLLSNLVKSPREILATEKVAKTFEQPSRLPRAKWSKDKTRYYHFHIDYGHETNQCRELKHQIEEAVKSGKLAHLVKGVKEKKEKTTGTRSEERKKEEKKPILDKVYVLMISGKSRNVKKRPANHGGIGEIAFPPPSKCGLIRSCHNQGEQSWPLGEIPLEVTIGEGPIAITKTLTFVIIKSYSPHNLLLGRTAMQQMGIVVSTVHGAIKFHTSRVKQKKKNLAPERNEAIHNQIEELTEAGILREVKYQTWVSNPMVVKKDNRKWKLRADFTNINKACIRKSHLLPAAKQKAEGLHKYCLKCFLDAYKGYHQISIAEKDEEKPAFFTREWVLCYKRLPFGLKNAGATYPKLIDKVFGHQMGRNIEVNVDDMVIKSDSEEEMMADITETLERLRAINLKLNPKKYSFGVEEGIYSVHLITKQGIRADPSKSAEKIPPFMKTLKSCTSRKMVQWTKEADEAFWRMKECLESLPTMDITTKGETLTMYLTTSEENMSAVLMAERGKKQIPVYFVSRTLHEAELKYPKLEKPILALVYTARKL
ncbi:reverse transcriptase domain-containing protein [Tanacetum coccineum]